MKKLYTEVDEKRLMDESKDAPWRDEFRRDYARVVHCSSLRRLQGKTQLFPGNESDFFRNRLTHSLEVSQIAESIACRLNYENEYFKQNNINEKLCATASLLHDIGHPPFGHNGERALNKKMKNFGGFEGNAQTLRIITNIERKKEDEKKNSLGLNLCYRTILSILKYDNLIPKSVGDLVIKGYYKTESEIVQKIKSNYTFSDASAKLKTVECQIMDLADDIAYSTYDLEDSFKAGFLSPLKILSSDMELLDKVAEKINKNNDFDRIDRKDILTVFYSMFNDIANNSPHQKGMEYLETAKIYSASQYLSESAIPRTAFTSQLVNKFIKGICVEINHDNPMLSRIFFEKNIFKEVEILKIYTFEAMISSARVKLSEYKGTDIIEKIFDALSDKDKGLLLMPDDVRNRYKKGDTQPERIVCDFISGMTDRFAIEFYSRLVSDQYHSIFKPI